MVLIWLALQSPHYAHPLVVKILLGIHASSSNSVLVVNGRDLVMLPNRDFSGEFGTGEKNVISIFLAWNIVCYLRFWANIVDVWKKQVSLQKGVYCAALDYNPNAVVRTALSVMKSHLFYGDDNVTNLSKTYREHLPADVAIGLFRKIGIHMQAGDKTSTPAYAPIEDVRFLKRGFRVDEEGTVFAPLDLKSIYKPFCFYTSGCQMTLVEYLNVQFDMAQSALFMHGRSVFDTETEKLRSLAGDFAAEDETSGVVFISKSYDHYLAVYNAGEHVEWTL
jgi:hypothetical protein